MDGLSTTAIDTFQEKPAPNVRPWMSDATWALVDKARVEKRQYKVYGQYLRNSTRAYWIELWHLAAQSSKALRAQSTPEAPYLENYENSTTLFETIGKHLRYNVCSQD